MIITRANVDQFPDLPEYVIRDIKQNGTVYNTTGGADEDGAFITDGGWVVNNGVDTLMVAAAKSDYFPWSKIPILADSDKDEYPSPNVGNGGSSPFNPNTKITVNKPQKPVIISSNNNNKLTNSSNNRELATNKGVMHFNGVVIEQLETFKKKYFLTKEAVNLVQDKLVESVISLYSKENSIDDNNVNSVKFMEFSEFDNNSFDELDLMSTIPAENLINNPDLMSGKLNEIAKNNGTVNVNARMAVIKENNKASAALVRTDGVLVTKEVPVYPANYIGNGYHMDIKNLGIEYALLPADSYSGLGLQGNIIQKYSNENKKFSYPEKVELPNKVENKRIEVPYPHQFNDAIIVFPRNSNLPPLYAYSGFPAIALKDKDPRPQQEQEFNEIKDSVKFTISFYEKATQEFGKKAAQLSRELAEQSKGKTIRNVEDALRTYEKYGQNINNKINAKDRAAIIKALESIDAKQLASNLGKFSKGLGYTNHAINAVELLVEFKNAVKTGNWRPFFVKAASITAGLASVALTAFAFSLIIGGPVGILGYALIIATVGALIDDALVEKVSGAIGI
ncbi:colicin-like pore-forming protein [Proteus vulgaris]|uniref:colicin-like pore-forming protein n=1 Tax=Proteus vulgaris TaxID=585 RepID=UPI0021A48775|nr:colicin-like pore-forming protein [Proteus vulgaris]